MQSINSLIDEGTSSSFQIVRSSESKIFIYGGAAYDLGNNNAWIPILVNGTPIGEINELAKEIELNSNGGYLMFKINYKEEFSDRKWFPIQSIEIIDNSKMTKPNNFYYKIFAHYYFDSTVNKSTNRKNLYIKKFYSSDLIEMAFPFPDLSFKEFSPKIEKSTSGDVLLFSILHQMEGNVLLLIKQFAKHYGFNNTIAGSDGSEFVYESEASDIELSELIYTFYYPDGTTQTI